MKKKFLISKLTLFTLIFHSVGFRSNAVEHKKNCPTDVKLIQKLVERFEDEEACKRMSLDECGIMMGATLAGGAFVGGAAAKRTVTAAVLAKRALFLGDSKMPSVAFSCKSTVAKNIWQTLLMPKAFAMQACTFNPMQNREEALKKYVELSEKALKEKMEEVSKAIQLEVDKGLSIASGEVLGNAPSSQQDIISSKLKAKLTTALNDSNKADRANNLLRGYAEARKPNEYLSALSVEDRKLMMKAQEAYNEIKPTIPSAPPASVKSGLSESAKDELKRIIAHGKENKEAALESLNQWSRKNKVSSQVITQLSNSISEVASIGKSSALYGAYEGRLAQISAALKSGAKVTKDLLAKMPLIDSLQSPQMLALRNFIVAKSGSGILGILDPISAFAESKLMASNVLFRMAGKTMVRAGGIVPNLVFASGNENFTLDQTKACLDEKSSEMGEYHEQLVDFDGSCQGTVDPDSEKFQNFLALPTINKVELLSKNAMVRDAYCKFIQRPEPSESYNIECLSPNSFSYKSKSGPPVSRLFSVENSNTGMKIKADFEDIYTKVKQCPKSYQYDSEKDLFAAADGSQVSKACSLNTEVLEATRYDLVQMSECCQGSSNTYCSINQVKRTNGSSKPSSDNNKATRGFR